MYIAITGSKNNKDVYIYRSFRNENGKSTSRIYKKLGKYNELLMNNSMATKIEMMALGKRASPERN